MDRRTLLGSLASAIALSRLNSLKAADTPPLKFDVSTCFDSGSLLWVPLRLTGAPPGLMHRPLRRCDDGSLRSAVVKVPAGWMLKDAGDLNTRIQIYVLTGDLIVGDSALPANSFASLPAGWPAAHFGTSQGAEILLISDSDLAVESHMMGRKIGDTVIMPRLPTDRTTRVWQDPESGANTSLIRVPPGWTVEGPEYHPCQEEIYCIAGDIAPDDIRILKTGWFLWNPPYAVHGYHLHSTAGGLVLEWHDRAWSRTVYRG